MNPSGYTFPRERVLIAVLSQPPISRSDLMHRG